MTVSMGKSNAALRHNISTWISFGNELWKAQTPQTCEDWGKEVHHLWDVTRGRVVGMSGSYRALGVIRCYLIYRMRRDSIKRLELGDISVRRVMENFLDQTKQLLQMSGGRCMLFRKVADVFTDTECLAPSTYS